MKTIVGITLILFGAMIAVFGHRTLQIREGRLMRFLSSGNRSAKTNALIQSIVAGILIIGFGISLIVETG